MLNTTTVCLGLSQIINEIITIFMFIYLMGINEHLYLSVLNLISIY